MDPIPSDIIVPSGFSVALVEIEGRKLYGAWAPGGRPLGLFSSPYEAAAEAWEELWRMLDEEDALRDAIAQMVVVYNDKHAALERPTIDVDGWRRRNSPSP